MNGQCPSHCCFSFEHIFYDSLLDRLAEIPFGNVTPVEDVAGPCSSKHNVIIGKIYTQFLPTTKVVDAMLISDGKVVIQGSVEQVCRYVKQQNISARFQYLSKYHSVCPGFIEPNIQLVLSAIFSQWTHLGPFGFDCSWQKMMPHYGYSYIARALLYLDKGIEPDNWLLAYGLSEVLLADYDRSEKVSTFTLINQLKIARPIVVLDDNRAVAYLNEPAMRAVYQCLNSCTANPFTSEDEFRQLLHSQQGLFDEQLIWLSASLPVSQLRTQLLNVYTQMHQIVKRANRQGITHLGVADSHPFSKKLLKQFMQTNPHINLIESKFEVSEELKLFSELDSYIPNQSANKKSIAMSVSEVSTDGYEGVQLRSGQFQLQPCQSLLNAGYNICLYCDYPTQPLSPLRVAEQASKRITDHLPGLSMRHTRVLLPEQRLSKVQSLHGITCASAEHLGCTGGKICEGELANFVHLSGDPLASQTDLRDLSIISCTVN